MYSVYRVVSRSIERFSIQASIQRNGSVSHRHVESPAFHCGLQWFQTVPNAP